MLRKENDEGRTPNHMFDVGYLNLDEAACRPPSICASTISVPVSTEPSPPGNSSRMLSGRIGQPIRIDPHSLFEKRLQTARSYDPNKISSRRLTRFIWAEVGLFLGQRAFRSNISDIDPYPGHLPALEGQPPVAGELIRYDDIH
jgi:hypothetical protein